MIFLSYNRLISQTSSAVAAVFTVITLSSSATNVDKLKPEDTLINSESEQLNISSKNVKIVGGTEVQDRTEFPYQVSLRLNNVLHFCGGSVIDDRNILTAAHCVATEDITPVSNIQAVIGDLSITSPLSSTLIRKIKHIFVHDEYDPETLQNDIAVLRIDSLGNFTAYINKIAIAAIIPAPNTTCVVSGWGRITQDGPPSDVLLYTNAPILSLPQCKLLYGALVQNGMLCAGYGDGLHDVCHGDSGSPLVCNNIQVGIVSYGAGCAVPYYPSVYTDVSYYHEWIRTQQERSNSNILVINLYVIIFSAYTYFL